ncbi:MAG TPA: hypothetical protein VLU46_06545 [Thermoanaerobaculia bacterium]|nr:hypothetical protein [Thermoanaerobaculia bacterium]
MLCAATANAGNVLVSYSFEDSLTDTGPDTFAVFQNAKGHVRLVSNIRYSGYRSIELRDVAGDGDFPELQGYFPERRTGELFFHFAMLVANPDQQLNIALAGPGWFTMQKDGIAFWLKTEDGVLRQVSDGIPKKLFTVEPFTWYVVDARCDIAKGTYDLAIRKEGVAAPIVDLKDQPNATSTAGSSVDKFSFVGSVFEDDSNVTYYVDDVVLGTDEKIVQGPFVAPGRRKLFIDRWREAKKLMAASRGCPPALSLADFGLRGNQKLEEQQVYKDWRAACAHMDANQFASLGRRYADAPIFALSELSAITDHGALVKRWRELDPRLNGDVRFGMIAAQAEIDDYFTMLWNGEYAAAARLAEEKGWNERAGDALFLSGSPSMARKYYERALREEPNAYWPTVKLSDVFHLLGDAANEKAYRQKMYGKLEE